MSIGHTPSVSDLALPAINFLIYIVLMVKLLKRPIADQLHARKEAIESYIKRAAMQWDQARRQLLDVQRRFSGLDTELRELANRIEADGKKEATAMVADAKTRAEIIIKRAHESAEAERKSAETQIRHELAQEVVRLASEKLAKELNSETDRPLRERALEGLRAISN